MKPFSLAAYSALAELIEGISVVGTGLFHPALGPLVLSSKMDSDKSQTWLTLTYGAVHWDPKAECLIPGRDKLLRLECSNTVWEGVADTGPQARLDVLRQEFRSRSSLASMTGMHAVMQLGALRLWKMLDDPETGESLMDANINGNGVLTFYNTDCEDSMIDICTGRILSHKEQLAAPSIPGFLWMYNEPMGAASFASSVMSILWETEDGEKNFPEGLEPVALSAHAKLQLLDGILAGYRGAGLPEPDLSGV